MTVDDRSRLTDEELVLLARGNSSSSASQVLVLRHWHWIYRDVFLRARRSRLLSSDLADAQQQAILCIYEGIKKFRANGDPGARSFRSYLGSLVRLQFLRFRRDRQRGFRPLAALTLSIIDSWSDPATILERREWWSRLEAGVAGLEEELHELAHCLMAGRSLVGAANYLQISYSTARRQRQHVLIRLAPIHQDCPEG